MFLGVDVMKTIPKIITVIKTKRKEAALILLGFVAIALLSDIFYTIMTKTI